VGEDVTAQRREVVEVEVLQSLDRGEVGACDQFSSRAWVARSGGTQYKNDVTLTC
jgi:hypothetical protein